ncbi:MAG: hypothetical protein AAFY60_12480 [Myxococcota bacterium]
MDRLAIAFLTLSLATACTLETPCPSGQRLAENVRDGALIRTCVSLADGKAVGEYRCTHPDGRSVRGHYEHNKKVGEWQYRYRGGELVRVEQWKRGVLLTQQTLVDDDRPALACGIQTIIETKPEFPDVNQGWSEVDGLAQRLYPDSKEVWMRGAYAEGLKHGPWEYRRRDGSVFIRGHYLDGLPNGAWIRFDARGAPQQRAIYRDGRLKKGPDLATLAASIRGLVSHNPSELSRDEVRRALEEALH